MRYLVDTHCWLWLQATPERLGTDVLEALANPEHDLLLSAASAWEIAIKYALGKLELPEAPTEYVPSRMQRSGTRGLPVSPTHALGVSALPMHHRDPFDRLLVVQAQQEGLALVSADHALRAYDIDLVSV